MTMRFDELGLHDTLMQSLKEMGFETPTPIQEQAIPLLMQGEDMIGQAQTGTGKTAAFGLPMLDRLLHHKHASPNAPFTPGVARPFGLVMAPTRELAIQVCEQMEKMGRAAKLNIVPVYGGQEIEKQLKRFSNPVDVVVGTPGRIMDHMERNTLQLDGVQVVVLDEADRMLDMGFVDDVVGILRHTPPTRQTSLFSATMPREVLNIAYEFMKSPQSVNVTPPDHLAVEKINQYYVPVDARLRPRALRMILQQRNPSLAIVFCRTKRGAERVGLQLKADGFRAKALHGDLTQKQRDEAMEHFREGRLRVLVATDIASRGLDVFDVSHVINYDLPEDHLTYVHRVGRTGRMGAAGEAIALIFPDQVEVVQQWAKDIGTTIQELKVEGLPAPDMNAVGPRGIGVSGPGGFGFGQSGGPSTSSFDNPNAGFGTGRSSHGGFGLGRSGHNTPHPGGGHSAHGGAGGGQTGGSGHSPSGHSHSGGFGAGHSSGGRGGERRSFGSGFGHKEGGREREGSRREGGFGRDSHSSRGGFGGRGGREGRSGGFGSRGGDDRFDRGSGMGRASVSPMTIKKIKERPLKAAKTEGHSRGHSYVGRQN
ncbi:putative ATP-dependent RNA helicase [uncultured archaeon]|nr:putative ATP-dependent RNA helicase [uncultured archaeon]